MQAEAMYVKRYLTYLNYLQQNDYDDAQWTSDYSTDNESNGYSWDSNSITTNAEQKLPNNELNYVEQKLPGNELTGESLVINKDTIQITDIKNNEQIPNSK